MTTNHAVAEARRKMESGRLAEAGRLCKQRLQRAPADTEAIRLYAEVAMRMNMVDEAIVILQKLLHYTPRDAQAHGDLARMLYQQQDYGRARSHAEKALALDARVLDAILLLGELELAAGREREADSYFKSLEHLPIGRRHVKYARLQAYMNGGDFEPAAKLLREFIASEPETADHYLQLARCRRLSAEHPDVALIRRLLDDDSGRLASAFRDDEQAAATAHMALYKLENDLGNYDAAFAHLQATKAAYLRANPLSGKVEQKPVEEPQKPVFTREFIQRMAPLACPADDPIFVVGMPRSGTTLLERILATNPEIAAAGELPIAGRVLQEVCARFGQNQFDTTALTRVPAALWKQLGEEYIKRARQRIGNARYFVDKLPGNFTQLGFIASILPNAHIIHLSRHPVATCFSIYEQDFGQRHPYALDLKVLGEQYVAYRQLMDRWRLLIGERIIELRYEEMVQDLAATAKRLGEQLGIPLDIAALENTQSRGRIHTASVWQARQPVHGGSVDRWQNYRQHLGPLLEALAPVLE